MKHRLRCTIIERPVCNYGTWYQLSICLLEKRNKKILTINLKKLLLSFPIKRFKDVLQLLDNSLFCIPETSLWRPWSQWMLATCQRCHLAPPLSVACRWKETCLISSHFQYTFVPPSGLMWNFTSNRCTEQTSVWADWFFQWHHLHHQLNFCGWVNVWGKYSESCNVTSYMSWSMKLFMLKPGILSISCCSRCFSSRST